ncbi:hypothetical protein LQW54_009235 [Pestalotiopsis sp. IQ-011]
MQLIFACWLLLLVASSTGTAFVSPDPSVSDNDLSISTTVHPVGSKFHIAWDNTILDRYMSVVLWQYNATSKDVIYPFEDVTPSIMNETSYDWIVTTDKDLSMSDLFRFQIFYKGDTSPSATSETFRITDDSTSSSSVSSATSSTTSASTADPTTSVGSSTTAATAGPTSASPAASSETGNGGLAIGTKIGLGVAVPVVALLGIAAGYCLFRHRAKKQQQPIQAPSNLITDSAMCQRPPSPLPYGRFEMDGASTTNELHSNRLTYELYGGATGQ